MRTPEFYQTDGQFLAASDTKAQSMPQLSDLAELRACYQTLRQLDPESARRLYRALGFLLFGEAAK